MEKLTYNEAQKITQKAIALTIKNNRLKLIALLKSYGVNMSASDSDQQIIVAVLVALKEKRFFRNDLQKLLLQTASEQTQNFTGDSGFFFSTGNQSRFFGEDGGEKEPKAKTGLGKYLQDNMGNILNKGLDTITTVITNKSNQKLVDKAKELEEIKLQNAAIQAAGAKLGTGAEQKTGLSTGAKVAIGLIAAAAAGTIIYFIVKK